MKKILWLMLFVMGFCACSSEEDKTLHTTEKIEMLYDGTVCYEIEIEKYYDEGDIYYHSLKYGYLETYVVSKGDSYYLKNAVSGIDTPWRELEADETQEYLSYEEKAYDPQLEQAYTIEYHDTDDETIRRKIAEASQMVEMSEKIEDETVLSLVQELLLEENAFYFKLSCGWPDYVDDTKQYEIDGGVYFLVTEDGISSWEDYEDMARSYYVDTYIQEVFTPYYVPSVFVEHDGKLYRAMADGVWSGLTEESIEVFKRPDGLYYATILTESDMEGSKNTYILEKVGEGKHMFRIVAKTGLL